MAALVGGTLTYAAVPPDRIAKGVSAGGIQLGGLTKEEAVAALNGAFDRLEVTYVIHGASAALKPASGFTKIDAAGIANRAANVGREDGMIRSSAVTVMAALAGRNVPLDADFDAVAFRAALEKAFDGKIDPSVDARLDIAVTTDGTTVKVIPDQDGLRIDFEAVADITRERIDSLDSSPVEIKVRKGAARISAKAVEPFVPAVERALRRAPLTVAVKGDSWSVSKQLVADWIHMTDMDGPLRPAIDRAKAEEFISARGANYAEPAMDAVFEMKDGKVTKFVPSRNGEQLDVRASIGVIEAALFEDAEPKMPLSLIMTVAAPKITTEASNQFGIKEIIGVGETNFAGSPKNRRINISVGAASVNGTLILPDAEFSMLKTLGTIDGTTGYLEELVIKKDKTTPEFGGGLCQIGSTAFRGALASGLPITMRQNHSYRVPYYEKDGDGKYIGPGKDATIYDPAPDFRFKNDTGHAILILTSIKGDRLTFTFWGVSDGRKSAQTDAVVSNIVPPPPKKIVKTVSIPAGTEKCTEHAHAGSDAVFTYTVTFASGDKKTVDFRSRYRPWQEVCLQGVTQEQLDTAIASGEVDAGGAIIPPAATADAAGATGN